jgi:ATP/maltotriose-dependent transcriptional regulator MalT
MLEQARESAEDVGLSEVMASVEYGYATLAREEGALDEARRRMARAAELIDASSLAPQFRAMTHSGQALIEGAAGDLAAARDLHVSAVEIAADTRDSPVMAQTLVGVADYALRLGEPARAAMLLGAADAVRGSEDRSVLDTARIRTAARAALGDAGYAEAYRSGADVTLETALAATGL